MSMTEGDMKRKIAIASIIAGAIMPNLITLALWLYAGASPDKAGSLLNGFAVIAVINIALVSFNAFMAIKKTHKPLRDLTLAAEQIAAGKLDIPVKHKTGDATESLAQAVESIRETMSNSFDALREYVTELQERVAELKFLTKVDEAILAGRQLDSIFDLITEEICDIAGADFSCITAIDNYGHIKTKSVYGFDQRERRLLENGLIGRTADSSTCPSISLGQSVIIGDISSSGLSNGIKEIYSRIGVKSMLAAPLISEDKSIGSIITWYKDRKNFTDEEVERFMLFADQTSVAIKSASLVGGMRSLNIEVMRALANAIDARDTYTANHSDRVSRFAVALAQELHLSEDEVQTVEYAGLLHDIGKIGIEESILNKPDSLTEEEMEIMKRHAIMSADIIKPIEFLKDVAPIVLYHHERYDGKGYPYGIAGDKIPFGARILAVADSLEAMTSTRPYRPEMSLREGSRRLSAGSGTQFDPTVVEAMIKVVERIELIENFDDTDYTDEITFPEVDAV